MGIPAEMFVKKLTDIADSQKDRTKEKGFRGIGRLAGVGYCDTLIFKSSTNVKMWNRLLNGMERNYEMF